MARGINRIGTIRSAAVDRRVWMNCQAFRTQCHCRATRMQ